MVFEKSLTAMVKGIRANRGKESDYINTCIQEIQKEVASKNLQTKSAAILKLTYLTMLGYDMSWATFAVVEVMSHNKFVTRRPGYLASAISFNDNTDVGLLTINLFKKDFGSKSQYESGMAISCLSCICTPQISRDILTDLSSLMSSSRAYLRKKTVLCLYRIFLKDPPALRTCFPKLKERLGDEDQGVLTATVNTFLELARKNARNYLSLVPQLFHILVNTTNNWLSIKLLKLFQLLCPLEARLPAKLVEPLTNLLNTTKAASVEFEVIRTVFSVLPEGIALTSLAVEKLQVFLSSSDRNLRYLALEVFKEALEKPNFRERYPIPELHGKVLQAIEEIDPTARMVALRLLDLIVSPSTFVDSVKKLMEFSRKSLSADEFHKTILRMGSRDCYALVEDFAWYLLVLADISRTLDSQHADEVAEQFTDIIVRVAGVRPYAVQLALSLLDRETAAPTARQGDDEDGQATSAASMEVSPAMMGSCAWILGEFHKAFEADAEACFPKAVKALVAARDAQKLDPSVQTMCIWAALKLCVGAPECAPAAAAEIRAALLAQLPAFVASTHVDVSERATLALSLVSFPDNADAADLFNQCLLPVAPGAQQALAQPTGLDLDEPFFPEEAVPETAFAPARADPTDPYALAATYKDDLGFMAVQEANQSPAAAVPSGTSQSSMYYLGTSKEQGAAHGGQSSEAAASAKPAAPLDPLEQMRQKLAAARAGAVATKYEVLRDEVRPVAAAAAAAAPTGVAATTGAAGSSALPTPGDKELADLHGRLWSVCYSDEFLRVYACVRSKNAKKQQLRLELRCERVAGGDVLVSDVHLRLPTGVTAQEVDTSGVVPLAVGPMAERSQKAKVTLGLTPFLLPADCVLEIELLYGLVRVGGVDQEQICGGMKLRLPATWFLSPSPTSQDEIASYMADHAAQLLMQQSAEALTVQMPGRTSADLAQNLAAVVGRCAGLCNLYGIQQAPATQNKSQKFLMVARPPMHGAASPLAGQEALPEAARIVCLCAGTPRDDALDIKVTVKACRKDVCIDVAAQLVVTFRELLEGRLRAA